MNWKRIQIGFAKIAVALSLVSLAALVLFKCTGPGGLIFFIACTAAGELTIPVLIILCLLTFINRNWKDKIVLGSLVVSTIAVCILVWLFGSAVFRSNIS